MRSTAQTSGSQTRCPRTCHPVGAQPALVADRVEGVRRVLSARALHANRRHLAR